MRAVSTPGQASPQAVPPTRSLVRVWDRPVRLLHGLLAGGALGCWVTGWWPSTAAWTQAQAASAHAWLGYGVGMVVLARLAWGWVGSPYARFAQFVRSPGHTWRYLRLLSRHQAPRHLGHNPLGGYMVLCLLAIAAGAALSGVLYTTDWLWGYGWLYRLHAALAWALLAAVAWHLAGIWFTARRHGDALVAAMLHGRKRR